MSRDFRDIIQRTNIDGLYRAISEIGDIDEEKRTISVAFSSETPVERWFGAEVLSHKKGAARLERLNDSGPLLVGHDATQQIGVIESAKIDRDKIGRAIVRFGRSPKAEEIFQDVRDGIRKHISVGYMIHELVLQSQTDSEETYLVTDWEPIEISIVPIPADPTVGVGRDVRPLSQKSITDALNSAAGKGHITNLQRQDSSMTRSGLSSTPTSATPDTPPAEPRATGPTNEEVRAAEQKRVSEILTIAREYGASDIGMEIAQKPDGSVSELQSRLLERQKGQKPVPPGGNSDVGMSERDLRQYSFVKLIRAQLKPGDRRAQDDAGFELEIAQEAQKKRAAYGAMGQGGAVVPSDVLRHGLARDGAFQGMTTGSNNITGPGSTGDATIQTSLLAGSYIEMLRNGTAFLNGIRMLGGLVGNIDIPKQTGATQGYWVGENDDAPASVMDFGNISLRPKTSAAHTTISRRLLEQTSLDVEALIRADLAKSMALNIDMAGYYGTGGDMQPTGLANVTGINALEFAGTFPTYQELVEMETLISLANAAVSGMRFKARADFKGYAKQTLAFPSTASGRTIWEQGGTVNTYACDISNQIKPGDLFFGNFDDIIMGMWGGLEVLPDPYSESRNGRIRITTFQDLDFAVRRQESFVIGRPKRASSSPATPAE